jgi:lipopolysaccharide transport system ATP-binding protein
MDETLIDVQDVSKILCRSLKRSIWYGARDIMSELIGQRRDRYDLRPHEFWANRAISFQVRRGECLGLIGRNGAGKTTLLRMLSGLIRPDSGRITMRGRVGALIALGAGFNPILTGRENIYINGSILGLSKREIDRKVEEIIDFAELRDSIDAPVRTFSSGMTVRLGFAIATAMNPDVVLLDEVLAVGDMSFRSKCYDRIGKIIKETAVIFVTHDMTQVLRICDQGLVLKNGNVVFHGRAQESVEEYLKLNDQPFESSLVLRMGVRAFQCHVLSDRVDYGGKLRLRLEFDAESNLEVGFALLSLSSVPGAFDAQSDISSELNVIPAGLSSLDLELGPIFLRKRPYHISISVSDKSRKITLAHAIGIASFEVNGPLGHGMPYQIPAAGIEGRNGLPYAAKVPTAADLAHGGTGD